MSGTHDRTGKAYDFKKDLVEGEYIENLLIKYFPDRKFVKETDEKKRYSCFDIPAVALCKVYRTHR